MQKWYMRAIKPTCVSKLRGSNVNSYGFRKNSSPDLIIGLIRHLQMVSVGLEFTLAMSIQDVGTAFEAMNHKLILKSLRRQGASVWAAGNLSREPFGFSAQGQLTRLTSSLEASSVFTRRCRPTVVGNCVFFVY